MACRPINEARDARIGSLARVGWSYGDIAKHLQVTRNVVAGVLHRIREAERAGQVGG